MDDQTPEGIQFSRFSLDCDEFAIMSFPIVPGQIPTLTSAEQEVLEGVTSGRSNDEIAMERGTSTRTVANQISAIFRKFGVVSRVELIRAVLIDQMTGAG